MLEGKTSKAYTNKVEWMIMDLDRSGARHTDRSELNVNNLQHARNDSFDQSQHYIRPYVPSNRQRYDFDRGMRLILLNSSAAVCNAFSTEILSNELAP